MNKNIKNKNILIKIMLKKVNRIFILKNINYLIIILKEDKKEHDID